MTQPSTQLSTPYLTLPGNSPRENPDVQEALSIKYSNSAVLVVPLSSGALAIFDRSFELQDIIDDPTAGAMATYSFAFKTRLASRTSEARFYGEPDDATWKADHISAARAKARLERAASRPSAPHFDTSDIEF